MAVRVWGIRLHINPNCHSLYPTTANIMFSEPCQGCLEIGRAPEGEVSGVRGAVSEGAAYAQTQEEHLDRRYMLMFKPVSGL